MENQFKNYVVEALIEKNQDILQINNYFDIVNNIDNKMLNVLVKNLKECEFFYFSVAFITMSGVQVLKKTLHEIAKKGIKGKIITGNYQSFSDPQAIKELMKFSNIQVKFDINNNLHAKGYYFKINDEWKMIIGSSNLTANALLSNHELNLLISGKDKGQLVNKAISQFEAHFANLNDNTRELIANYQLIYEESKAQKQKIKYYIQNITPNKMQIEALNKLNETRKNGKKSGVVISATGSGKHI